MSNYKSGHTIRFAYNISNKIGSMETHKLQVGQVGATTTKSLSYGFQFCKIDEVGNEYHYHGPFGGLWAYNVKD